MNCTLRRSLPLLVLGLTLSLASEAQAWGRVRFQPRRTLRSSARNTWKRATKKRTTFSEQTTRTRARIDQDGSAVSGSVTTVRRVRTEGPLFRRDGTDSIVTTNFARNADGELIASRAGGGPLGEGQVRHLGSHLSNPAHRNGATGAYEVDLTRSTFERLNPDNGVIYVNRYSYGDRTAGATSAGGTWGPSTRTVREVRDHVTHLDRTVEPGEIVGPSWSQTGPHRNGGIESKRLYGLDGNVYTQAR